MVKDTLQNATGPVEYTLTNDYMFRAVCQKNERVLKGLICSLLSLTTEEVRSITIQNPIQLGETITDKDIVLDIRILLNDNHLLNIEMQVADELDWTKRSLFYLCRLFTNLKKGESYSQALPALHIGILNFTLFPNHLEFYSKNAFMNVKTHQIYSSDLTINVLDLNCIHLATEEDKACELDYWAS